MTGRPSGIAGIDKVILPGIHDLADGLKRSVQRYAEYGLETRDGRRRATAKISG